MLFATLVGCRAEETHSTVPKEDELTNITYITSNLESEGTVKVITDLSAEYTKVNPNVKLEYNYVGQSGLRQRIQLLAASNDLPTMFSFESGRPLRNLMSEVLDLQKTFKDLGIYEKLNPIAVNLLKQQTHGGGLYALPLELNIEGFWYNKSLFAKYGIEEPRTWDDMLQAADLFIKNGIQPFSVAGKEKWPITRLIGGYAVRKYGPDVMESVEKGEMKVTAPGFVEAAQTVYDMSKKGYFGPDANTIDSQSSIDLFLQGNAAMFYSGSWELRDFNNPVRNKLGSEGIGYFNIPLVKDGSGTLDEFPMNAGLTNSFSKEAFNPIIGEWMKTVFSQYGDRAMKDSGLITGFKVEHMPAQIPPLTQMVQEKIESAKRAVLWFEANFDSKTQSVAWDNAQLLISSDSMTAQSYMEELQKAIDVQLSKPEE
ncbi:ABC transporter substrate-binding protein [Paenibacillus sp. LjRoot153]|uniref:ABC transporter substrate-binding protein n=1 Tax=Paenibacillus sp. LjRoot153 TaxID=3342270 RepID=UPI003F5033C5